MINFDEMKVTSTSGGLPVCAANCYNLLKAEPPGCGRLVLAKLVPSILHDLTEEVALQV